LDVFAIIKARTWPFRTAPAVTAAGQAPDDEQHHQDRHQRVEVRPRRGEGGVVAKAVLAMGEDDEADEDADQDRRGNADPHGCCRAGRGQAGHGGPVPRQVGEQNGQLVASPGLQGLARPLVELVGGEPASLEVLAELRDGAVAVGVGYAQITGRVGRCDGVHETCSFWRGSGTTDGTPPRAWPASATS
jgi:hypothetical protein